MVAISFNAGAIYLSVISLRANTETISIPSENFTGNLTNQTRE